MGVCQNGVGGTGAGELGEMGLTRRSCAKLFELITVEDWVLVVVCACVELDVGYAVKILKGIWFIVLCEGWHGDEGIL